MSTARVVNPYVNGRGPKPLPVMPRLLARSHDQGACRIWTGPVDKDGYGTITVRNRKTRTSRAAWEARHGPIPDGLSVLHRCDTPACIADAHLYLGTQADNMRDRRDRGRWRGGHPRKAA